MFLKNRNISSKIQSYRLCSFKERQRYRGQNGHNIFILKAPIATKVVCFSRLLKYLRSLYGKQCGPRSVCSGSTLLASILNSSVLLGNYLQQTTSADDIFRCIFLTYFSFQNVAPQMLNQLSGYVKHVERRFLTSLH